METPLTEEVLENVSRIVMADDDAPKRSDDIFRSLGLSALDIKELKQSLEPKEGVPCPVSDFFKDVLRKYKAGDGSRATVGSLHAIFQELGLTKVTENLEAKYGLPAKDVTTGSSENNKQNPGAASIAETKALEYQKKIEILKQASLAVHILKIVSFFNAEIAIPEEIFKHLDPNPEKVAAAISNLIKSSFATTDGSGNIYVDSYLHLLQDDMSDEEMEATLDKALAILDIYMSPPRGEGISKLVKNLTAHSMSVWNSALPYPDLVRKYPRFPRNVCNKFDSYETTEEMLVLARDFAKGIRPVLGSTHEETLHLVFLEALSLHQLENFSQSAKLLENNLEHAEETLGKEHKCTLRMTIVLARNAGGQGNYQMQLNILENVERISEKKHGENDSTTLLAQFYKAHALYNLRRMDPAFRLCNELRQKQVEMPGFPGDTWDLSLQALIAAIYRKRLDFPRALEISRSIHEALKEQLGEEHATTVLNMENIRICEDEIARRR